MKVLRLALGASALLSSCATHHQAARDVVTAEPLHAPAPALADTAYQAAAMPAQHKGFLRDLFRSKPEPVFEWSADRPTPPNCKKCTFNVVGGNQSVAGKKAAAGDGATNANKPAGPMATNGSTSQDLTKQGQRGGAAASAPGAIATATTTKPGFWQAAMPIVGVLGGIGLVYWLVLGGGAVWLAATWRRNKATDNQA